MARGTDIQRLRGCHRAACVIDSSMRCVVSAHIGSSDPGCGVKAGLGVARAQSNRIWSVFSDLEMPTEGLWSRGGVS